MGCCIGKLCKGQKTVEVNNGFHRKPADVSVDKVMITESPVLRSSDVAYSSSYSAKSPISSSSSSASSIKDRTFSNEFLVSCLKDNPHVVTQLNPSPTPTHSLLSSGTYPKVFVNKPKSAEKPAFVFETRSVGTGHTTPQRLQWQNSPSPGPALRKCPLTTSQDTAKYYASTRKAAHPRSPTPSRRFNNSGTKPVSSYKVKRVGTSQRGSPLNNLVPSTVQSTPRRLGGRCSAYADSAGANRQVSSSSLIGEMECMTLEDLDNPLISLDCFIFV